MRDSTVYIVCIWTQRVSEQVVEVFVGIDVEVVGVDVGFHADVFEAKIRVRQAQRVHPEHTDLKREFVCKGAGIEFDHVVEENGQISLYLFGWSEGNIKSEQQVICIAKVALYGSKKRNGRCIEKFGGPVSVYNRFVKT